MARVQCLAQRRREPPSEIDERPERSRGEHRIAAGDQCAYLGVLLAHESTDHGALANTGLAGNEYAAPVAAPSVRDCRVQRRERVLTLQQQCLTSLRQGSNRGDANDTRRFLRSNSCGDLHHAFWLQTPIVGRAGGLMNRNI